MAERKADTVFAQLVLSSGIMTQEQIDECRHIRDTLYDEGLTGRALSSVAREKGYIAPAILAQVQREMRKQGINPRLGGFELLVRLGSGAMGSVYKAKQISLDRFVALKVLHRELAHDEQYVARFQREAMLAAKITHPNAVQVFDVGLEEGRRFMVMEYVDGTAVDEMLAEDEMEERRALEIVRDTAKALAQAHGQGIVHRDVKPANILVASDGSVKLSDLGIAKDLDAETLATLTRTGTTVGTPRYMSPEQCRGGELDHRADVYSLGMTLYRMVCARDAFEGDTPVEVMHQHVQTTLPDPAAANPSLSPGTVQLLKNMTAKDPAQRVQNCTEVAERIDAILSGKVTTAKAPKGQPKAKGGPPPLPTVARAPALKKAGRAKAASGKPRWLLPSIIIAAAIVIAAIILAIVLSHGGS